MAPTRQVLLVEDQSILAEFLAAFVRARSWHVMGICATLSEAAAALEKGHPDVVLLDLNLPDGSGLDASEQWLRQWPTLRILVLSSACDEVTLHRLTRLGVRGYINKRIVKLELLEQALDTITAGGLWFGPEISRARQSTAAANSWARRLTSSEIEVLPLIGIGLDDREVGDQLGIAATTAKTHRQNIMRKLDLHTRGEVIRFARQKGFTDRPD